MGSPGVADVGSAGDVVFVAGCNACGCDTLTVGLVERWQLTLRCGMQRGLLRCGAQGLLRMWQKNNESDSLTWVHQGLLTWVRQGMFCLWRIVIRAVGTR